MMCKAKGKGWVCEREAVEYCPAHTAQLNRGTPLRPLRRAHGKSLDDLVPVAFNAPKADVAAIVEEARGRKTGASTVYREALRFFIERKLTP